VGTNIGAGQRRRALRIALIGGGIAFAMTEAIGVTAALLPRAWLGLFGSDPGMLAAGSAYLRAVGPFYGFFGLGLALYFASQGAGKLGWPLLAGFLRMLIAIGGGWLALRATGSPQGLFVALGLGMLTYGVLVTLAVSRGSWFARTAPAPQPVC
jgi:Na+-driven multidrug efflux pump